VEDIVEVEVVREKRREEKRKKIVRRKRREKRNRLLKIRLFCF
jgi:hypothetical protein